MPIGGPPVPWFPERMSRVQLVGGGSCFLWVGFVVEAAPEQAVGFTNYAFGGFWAIGRDGSLSQVAFQEQFVGPDGVLQEGDVVGARPLEGSHLVGCRPQEM